MSVQVIALYLCGLPIASRLVDALEPCRWNLILACQGWDMAQSHKIENCYFAKPQFVKRELTPESFLCLVC